MYIYMPNTYNICLFIFYIVVCSTKKKKCLWATELINGSYSTSEDGAVECLELSGGKREGKRKREY